MTEFEEGIAVLKETHGGEPEHFILISFKEQGEDVDVIRFVNCYQKYYLLAVLTLIKGLRAVLDRERLIDAIKQINRICRFDLLEEGGE